VIINSVVVLIICFTLNGIVARAAIAIGNAAVTNTSINSGTVTKRNGTVVTRGGTAATQGSNTNKSAAATDKDTTNKAAINEDGSETSTSPPAQPSLVKNLSPGAREIADIAGITPLLVHLEKTQAYISTLPDSETSETSLKSISAKQKLLYLRLALNTSIQSLNLQINATRGTIEATIAQADGLRAYITEQRNRITHRNTQVNLVSGGITKMVGFGIALAPNITSIPTNVLEVFDGGVQFGLSTLALHEQHREKLLEHGVPTLLESFLENRTLGQFPQSIWTYLSHPPIGGSTTYSRRQLLIKTWQDTGILPKTNRHAVKAQTQETQQLTVDLLDQRLAMLYDLKSVVSQMHTELMELSNSILKSYSEDPVW
jgi:hypothetical protein